MTALEHEVDVPFCTEGFKKRRELNMREGVLMPGNNCIDVRFGCDDYYGGLSCGTTLDVWLDDQWVSTHIEQGNVGWYLEGVEVKSILGLKVRL